MTLPEEEQKVLDYWDSISILDRLQKAEKPKGRFQFTEGPPTANGLPGVHHVLSRCIKDIIIRYKFMDGFWVPRKAGWDTHGLPVEIEVEKDLGLDTKKDVMEYGIDKFNKKCKESVFRYVDEWEKATKRMAFWLDMEDAYITCENYYMESVWWSLKQIFDKGLIYKGHKIVPYCPRCETPLSSHELAQGYENITETSIYIKFQLKDPNFDDVKAVAWTTTPWTLLSNVALAVNPDSRYSLVKHDDEKLIIATNLVDKVLGEGNYEKIREFYGSDLVYKQYEPLFPYFEDLSDENGFVIVTADFVDTEPTEGNISTGFVHIAPAFGEDDFEVSKEFDLPFVQPINEDGYFDESIPELEGKYFKVSREEQNNPEVFDVDEWVIDQLLNMDKLLSRREYSHDYPFCWRCKRALLYYARESWFIEMSRRRFELLEQNDKVNWVPETIGEGRFGNFLDNVRDWAISRERFWGTPFPIWICTDEDCEHKLAVGSYEELKELSKGNVELEDYHKPMIDDVIIPCPECGSDMERTPEVIDCWYDSGSAPFAQYHYPFENEELIDSKKAYPIDFIAEGMDQTRGWFYTMHAIATVVFDQNAYKNCVVNGIVLDAEGQKMSKSVGNTIDPWEIFNLYGADALRWLYYVSGPPHKDKRLSFENVRNTVSQFITKYWHSYLLFSKSTKGLDVKPSLNFDPNQLENPLDKWMISRINYVNKKVKSYLDDYTIYYAALAIQEFVANDLSNWYLRLVRDRFLEEDEDVYNVMFYVFDKLNRMTAPFVPFLTERIFLRMQDELDYFKDTKSVHLLSFPDYDDDLIDESLDEEMDFVNEITQDLRALRDKVRIKIRQPIKEYLFYLKEDSKKEIIEKYQGLIKSELNVKELNFVKKEKARSFYEEELILNHGTIGRDFKQDRLKVEEYLKSMDIEELKDKISKGKFKTKIEGKEYTIKKEHFEIEQEAEEPYEVKLTNYGIVLINSGLDEDLLQEGFARDFIRNIQSIRKELELSRFKEKIIVNIVNEIDPQELLGEYIPEIKDETGTVKIGSKKEGEKFSFEIQDQKLDVYVQVK